MIFSLGCVIWPLACTQTAVYNLYSIKSSVLLRSLLVFFVGAVDAVFIVINLSGMTVLVIVVVVHCRLSIYFVVYSVIPTLVARCKYALVLLIN